MNIFCKYMKINLCLNIFVIGILSHINTKKIINKIEKTDFNNSCNNIIHFLVGFPALFGFLLPKKYLIYHLSLYPLFLFHWYTNNGNCFFTEIEKKITNYVPGTSPPLFLHELLMKFGINIDYDNEQQKQLLNQIIFGTSWLISYIRIII